MSNNNTPNTNGYTNAINSTTTAAAAVAGASATLSSSTVNANTNMNANIRLNMNANANTPAILSVPTVFLLRLGGTRGMARLFSKRWWKMGGAIAIYFWILITFV
jgi:hypothetical protein